jgi:hypothetical protein
VAALWQGGKFVYFWMRLQWKSSLEIPEQAAKKDIQP